MLEATLEKLLLRFLAPYVDGISKDNLHLGVFKGSLELKDLRVRPDALTLLGWEGLRVKTGTITVIKLAVPWSKLYTGKVKASVECLHLEVESISEGGSNEARVVEEMRAAKQKAIEVRVEQLLTHEQEREDGEEASEKGKGYGVRLARKIINNITAVLQEVKISFINNRRGLACGLEFPSLDVLSTDQTFRERDDDEVVVTQGSAMYKILRLRELGIRMSPVGVGNLAGAEYILSPISASLQLAHVPMERKLRICLEVATRALAEATLRRSQVKHLRSIQADLHAEAERLQQVLVPAEEERSIYEDPEAALAEYGRLYERRLFQEEEELREVAAIAAPSGQPLSEAELRRIGLLQDAFSSRLLARERLKVRKKVEALHEEVARRQSEAEKARLEGARRSRPGLFARWRGRGAAEADEAESPQAGAERLLLSAEEREQLMRDLEDESKVETVDLPNLLCFEFLLGQLALRLEDDRWPAGEPQRQLLHLDVKGAKFKIDVNLATDHRGQDSAEWRMELRLRSFQARHAQLALVRLHEDAAPDDGGPPLVPPPVDWEEGDTASLYEDAGEVEEDEGFQLEGGAGGGFGRDAGDDAATLVLQSLCEKEQNLLKLCFSFMPVEVHMLPGIVELLLEFFRAQQPVVLRVRMGCVNEGEQLGRAMSRDFHMEEGVEIAKQWLEAHEVTAKGVAERVLERIPDKMHLEVRIASPILFIPVEGLGTSTISLGCLHVLTPQACEYRSIDLELELNHTTLRAVSLRGERFDMIQPVPVGLNIEYRATEDMNAMHIQVKVKEFALSLAPQAVQILLATPSAFLQILYPSEVPQGAGDAGTPAAAAQGPAAAVGSEAASSSASVPAAAAATSPAATLSSSASLPPTALRRTAAAVAEEVLGGESVYEAVARRAEEVRSKQFKLDLAMEFEALDLTLADSIVPVIRCRVELLRPGLVLHRQKDPNLLTLNIGAGTLEMEVLNPRSGAWEPLLERCRVGLDMERKAIGSDDNRATHVILSGQGPVLLSLTPNGVRRAAWILPLFAQSLASAPPPPTPPAASAGAEAASPARAAVASLPRAGTGVKYRVVNLCEDTIELRFRSKHHANLVTKVEPTGSQWVSLDEQVLPHFATAVSAKLPSATAASSEMLPLERSGAVAVPGTGYVAELLAPEPSHRLLLIGTPLRVHNQTDLTLLVRFHDAAQRAVLPVDMQPTAACDAALLGRPTPGPCRSRYSGRQPTAEGVSFSLELLPNACCAVPAAALVRAQGTGYDGAHVWVSARPAGVNVDFCEPLEVGSGLTSRKALCRKTRGTVAGVPYDGLHLLCESDTSLHPLPAPIGITTIALRPSLVLLNALPVGDLTVRYAIALGCQQKSQFDTRETVVPRFTRVNDYDLPALEKGESLALSLRMDGEAAPLSRVVSFNAEALVKGEADAVQALALQQRPDGAAAGVTVEPIGHFELRLACPAWFSDRSGLTSPFSLVLLHDGKALPSQGGISLLPAEHTEESCELLLRSAAQAVDVGQGVFSGVRRGVRTSTKREVRLPPNWCVVPWLAACGPLIFCVQTDDVAAADVLGAQCQVLTLRPRLVLTNSSSSEVEVRFVEMQHFRVLRLPAHGSLDYHWAVKSESEEAPSCTLQFRPMREPSCNWSGVVVCGDAAAGATPFGMACVGAAGPRKAKMEIWTVEVAPVRGALAVSFRLGSDFVAVNRSARQDVHMAVRPSGCDEKVADLPVPVGAEVPYGWPQPFGPQQQEFDLLGSVGGICENRRAVEVVLRFTGALAAAERRFKVKDARKTQRYPLRGFELAVDVARVGTKTFLSLVDLPSSSRQGAAAAAATSAAGASAAAGPAGLDCSTFQLDVKISCLGVSFVQEQPVPRELLYLHLELLRLEFRQAADEQSLKFAVSEAQVDCQLPGRVDARSADRRRDASLALWQQERPAVIFANCADGDRAFLTVVVRRGATSSRDTFIPLMEISLDACDVTIDNGWLDPFEAWWNGLRGEGRWRGVPWAQVSSTAGRPIVEGYEPPPLPPVVQVDALHISPVCLTVWCALKLKSVRFLPMYVRTALRVLSMSGIFTLDGASLRLEERRLPPHRGSLADFARGLVNEYSVSLLKEAAGMLGKSSVVKWPRMPLSIGMTGISYLGESVGLAAAEAASLVNLLTFDEEYVARQRQLRAEKKIQNVGDGLVEAGKSLAQGLEGFLDVVKKPAEGFRTDGVGGFIAGVGKGLVGAFAKPVSKVGQAISDVGAGLAAQVTPDTASMKRRRARARVRLPRLLFTELGAVRRWNPLEAELLRQLGEDLTRGVEEVVPLTPEPAGAGGYGSAGANAQLVLLLFQRRLLLAEAKVPFLGHGPDGAPSTASTASGVGGAAEVPGHRRRLSGPAVQSGGSSSSSAVVPRDKPAPSLDVLEAIDESATRIAAQAMKPFNTVLYGMQDLKCGSTGSSRNAGAPTGATAAQVWRHAVRREFSFRGLHSVRVTAGNILQLEDASTTLHLPLDAALLGEASREALAAGFRAAAAHREGIANWDALRVALHEERRQRLDVQAAEGSEVSPAGSPGGSSGSRAGCGAGQRVLEVFEVEWWDVLQQEWKTPALNMSMYGDMTWRWLDSTGSKHPHLDPRLTRDRAAAQKSPPCGLDRNLFQPTGPWVKDIHAGTDKEGWRYGMAWNASTWEAHAGPFDGVRRRRWTRTYA